MELSQPVLGSGEGCCASWVSPGKPMEACGVGRVWAEAPRHLAEGLRSILNRARPERQNMLCWKRGSGESPGRGLPSPGPPGTNMTPRRPGSLPRAHHGLCWGGWAVRPEGSCARWRCPPAAQTEGPGLCWREGTSEGTSANLAVAGRRCRHKRLGPGLGRSARLSQEALTPQGTGSWTPLWLLSRAQLGFRCCPQPRASASPGADQV